MNMDASSISIPRAPFFGSYIMKTVENGCKKETAREKREREARMRALFESVDDYVEQA